MKQLKVLVACEYSGVFRDAFTALGHSAMSCDLLPTDVAGAHHEGDVIAFLESLPDNSFDLIIAHPACTALCVAGNSTYGECKPRYVERLAAAKWTESFWELAKRKAPAVAFENPVGVLARLTSLPKASYVQPYQFGHLEQKKTGLHLHGLPPLMTTDDVYDEMMKLPKCKRERLHYLPPSPDRWKLRSTSFKGIAQAAAAQWSTFLSA